MLILAARGSSTEKGGRTNPDCPLSFMPMVTTKSKKLSPTAMPTHSQIHKSCWISHMAIVPLSSEPYIMDYG